LSRWVDNKAHSSAAFFLMAEHMNHFLLDKTSLREGVNR
jgi:hypothetical protein